jgi:3-ketoacyl-CoA synthase
MVGCRYTGKDKSRLVTNMLFRMGASAVLLSNKPSWASRAKYTLHKAVRVHTAAVEDSYK